MGSGASVPPKGGAPPDPLKEVLPFPPGPTVYLTSIGFISDTQWARFIQVVMHRRGVLKPEDGLRSVDRAYLVKKYEKELQLLKVTYINDASYHRPTEVMVKYRAEDPTYWDIAMNLKMGIPKGNIKTVQLLEKPWLFNRPGREANYDPSSPNVANLDPADEKEYYSALKLTQDAFNALKEDPPQVGAGQAGGTLPGCPSSGRNCADELASISTRLNDKYADALDKWCTENIDGADIVVGEGGEVVLLNMTWQCNQAIADRLVHAVRTNRTIYCGNSASTMVTAKSMEMTGEIQPGWIEAFAADSKYLSRKNFDANDLDAEGVSLNVLGALPLLEAPIAMRPHYCEKWAAKVLEKNLIAEKEFEKETGIDIPDDLVCKSHEGHHVACSLLSFVSRYATDQDHPVFVPLKDGHAIEVTTHFKANKLYEKYTVIE